MRTTPLVLLFACSTPLPEGHVVDDVSAPVPFTSEEIAAYNTAGRTWTFRVDSASAGPMRRTMAFTDVDDEGAWVESSVGGWDDEQERVETTRVYSTWSELQRHAAYPSERTGRDWAKVRLPEGRVSCVMYTVTEADGRVTEACFDPARPGPPVHMAQLVDGTAQFTMALQSVTVSTVD